MDNKIKKYEHIILQYLTNYIQKRPFEGLEYQLITDNQHGHYQVILNSWDKDTFRHVTAFHLQINQETQKIWLWVNNTDIPIAEELTQQGVPPTDIVLGFHPSHLRQYTGFAVA